MDSKAVHIETYPNAQWRAYHTRIQLIDQPVEMVERGASCTLSSHPIPGFAELLLKIPGVASVTLRPYTADVQKAVAFEWNEIEPRILEVLTCQLE